LGLAKDLVVFPRRDVTVVQSGNDRAVRVWKLSLAVGLDRRIVAQNGTNTVQVACFVGDGDQPPVSVSGGIFVTKIGAAESSACRDAGAVNATIPARITAATSSKVILFIVVPPSGRLRSSLCPINESAES
jgi:hypothetical protein